LASRIIGARLFSPAVHITVHQFNRFIQIPLVLKR
jgi:hypothetical protein